MKTFKQFQLDPQQLDENLRPLVKGASYLMRKLAKKSKTFNNLAKKGLANTTIKMPNIKKSDLSQYAMYHGTAKKSADKIMKSGFKKSKDSVMNPDRSVIKKKNRAFATTDPEVAKVYADMAAKRTGGKPEILAVKVRDSKLYQPLEGKHRGEYYIKTKEMKPVGRDVKPIKIKNGEVMQNSFNPLKTYKQFQLDSQQLDEGLGTVAKVAMKGAVKFAKKGGLKKVGKKVGKLFKKKPRRTIDPFFADKAVERGTMVRGYHGQSAKNIAQYKKTGVPPAVSGTNPSNKSFGHNKATQDWMKRTGYKGITSMARPGKDAYFSTATDMGKKQATKYKIRGARFENEKLKNQLNPFRKKDKGEVMDVVVNKKSIRKSWKKLPDDGTATERIAKAQDIIPVVPGPSAKVGKFRLTQQLRKDRKLNRNNIA